jgi:hypothetical protein
MRGILPITLLLAFVLLVLASCMEEEPAEISVIAKLDGKGVPVNCQLFNSKGKQISEQSSDYNGITYFRQVPPGTYTIKFTDNQYNYYPAVKTVTVEAGASMPVKVELNEAPTAEEGAPAPE